MRRNKYEEKQNKILDEDLLTEINSSKFQIIFLWYSFFQVLVKFCDFLFASLFVCLFFL